MILTLTKNLETLIITGYRAIACGKECGVCPTAELVSIKVTEVTEEIDTNSGVKSIKIIIKPGHMQVSCFNNNF